jgi:molybdopterin molybdotransferase
VKGFFHVRTSDEAKKILVNAWNPEPLGEEVIPITQALGRITAESLMSSEDIPPFHRSTIDGFAVRAKDTFGASEALPAILKITGEVEMGHLPKEPILTGQTARIWTGGTLPEGTDACVMIEYTHLADEETVLIEKPVAPGENVIRKGEDMEKGRLVFEAGRVLRPFEIGAMAALGHTAATVVKRPKIAIISTGDEIILPHKTPGPGQIRDINTYSLAASALATGALPFTLGIAGDGYTKVSEKVERGLSSANIVVVSGGSSVGARDVVVNVLEDLGPPGVLVHGVAMKPGKPLIMSICQGKPVFGLPGHPVSALTTFDVFVKFAIRHLYNQSLLKGNTDGLDTMSNIPGDGTPGRIGQDSSGQHGYPSHPLSVKAILSRNISSAPGREDHIRVKLRIEGNDVFADPVLGKSGLISILVDSHGEIVVPVHSEGLKKGTLVDVRIY